MALVEPRRRPRDEPHGTEGQHDEAGDRFLRMSWTQARWAYPLNGIAEAGEFARRAGREDARPGWKVKPSEPATHSYSTTNVRDGVP